jgi:hypothetical protein
VSTSAITPVSLLENSLATITPSSPNQPTLTNASTVNAASKITNDTTGESQDTLTHDTVTLLKDLEQGDVSAANTELDQLKTDLQTQAASTTSTKINKDLTALLKDLSTNNDSAAKTDITNLKTDLQTQDASTANSKSSSSQNVSPLAALLSKITDRLNTGSVQGALEDVAGYLVQNGQVTGSLLNVTA